MAEPGFQVDDKVDITDVNCPVTFVKTKVALEELDEGQILQVHLKDGEPVQNVPRSLKEEGHEILKLEDNGDGTFELYIKKTEISPKDIHREDQNMKRILTIQDISCFGKCSLTVALPLLSVMGIETVILPTAVLSTHTLFKGFTCKDLSDQLEPITNHWKQEGITFDAIYTGYLGTEEEIDTVIGIIETFRNKNTLVFVDPAMGDNGRLYPAFDEHYARKNADLCAVADIVDPNITEASFLTGLPYKEIYTEDYIKEMLLALADIGTKTPILTGVSLSDGKTGAMGYDTKKREFFHYQNDRIPASYHGTGDIFSSVLAGAFVLDLDRKDALRIAADYTALTIEETLKKPGTPWYGVDFESTIPVLIDALKQIRL